MSADIKIIKAPGTWVIRVAGAVVAETTSALELSEGRLDPVIYFPREDIAMALLEPEDHVTQCPHKGEAKSFAVAAKSGVIARAAWSYERPIDDVSRIADHIAFDPNKVTIEQL